VIEIDEVLVARIASGFSTGTDLLKNLALDVSSSVAASIARSTPPSSFSVSAGRMRAIASARACSSSLPEATCRAMLPEMVAMPFSMRSGDTS
jgi:hypothetical protein